MSNGSRGRIKIKHGPKAPVEPPPPPPAPGTLADEFSTIDTAEKWTLLAAGTATIEVVSGQLVITPPASTSGSNTRRLRSTAAYDLTDKRYFIEVPEVTAASFDAETTFALSPSPTEIYFTDGAVRFTRSSPFGMIYREAGVTSASNLTYNATTHRWWAFRIDSTNVYWETSDNGLDWVVRRTVPRSTLVSFNPAALYVHIMAGTFASVAAPGKARYDNLNITPAPPPPPPPPPVQDWTEPVALGAPVGAAPKPTVLTRHPIMVGRVAWGPCGDVNPNGTDTKCWFEYGTDPTLGTFTRTPTKSDRIFPAALFPSFMHRHWLGTSYPNNTMGAGAAMPSLTPNTTYYYRLCASNTAGESKGNIVQFKTIATRTQRNQYPCYPHARFGPLDHRFGGDGFFGSLATPRWGLTQEHVEDEYWFLATHGGDLIINGAVETAHQYNTQARIAKYDTLFWFVPPTNTLEVENWLTNNGYPVENAFLHHAAGQTVQGYTHNVITSRVVSTHVASGNKVLADRMQYAQFAGRQGYYYTNPNDPGFRAFRLQRTQNILKIISPGNRNYCLMYDSHGREIIRAQFEKIMPGANRATLEYPIFNNYVAAHDDLLVTDRATAWSNRMILNTAQRFNKPDEIALNTISGGVFAEFVAGPYGSNNWNEVGLNLANDIWVVYNVSKLDRHGIPGNAVGGYSDSYVGTVRNQITPGNYATITDRVTMFEYIGYLSVLDPNNMDRLYHSWNIETMEYPIHMKWMKAFEYPIGMATGARTVVSGVSSPDPAGYPFTLYTREFQNARIYIRGVISSGSTNYGDLSAVNVTLPTGTSWRRLNADGTRSTPMTTFQIRHGEGIIFIKG